VPDGACAAHPTPQGIERAQAQLRQHPADGTHLSDSAPSRHPERPFQLKVRAGSARFIVDEPLGVGGLGSGPNPYDLLSAALGACSVMTVRLYATRRKWPLEGIRVNVIHHRSGLDAVDAFHRKLQLEERLSVEQEQKLLAIAAHCPVHETIRSTHASIETTASTPEKPLVPSGPLRDGVG
jgi:putative redox protein